MHLQVLLCLTKVGVSIDLANKGSSCKCSQVEVKGNLSLIILRG